VKQARADGLRVRYVQRDRDGKFTAEFDATLRKSRSEAAPSPAKAPNTQAFVERFIGSIRRECLDHSFSSAQSIWIASSGLGSNITTPSGRIKDVRTNFSFGRFEPRSPKPPPQRFSRVNAHLELTHFVPSRIDPPGVRVGQRDDCLV